MRTLVFVACVLAIVTVSDAQLNHDIKETIISKVFDIKELIECHLTFAECAVELGLLKIPRPELSNCIAQKKNLTVGDGQLNHDIRETIISKVFNIKELIECHLICAECAVELGLIKIPRPELPYCIAQKKNLIDKEGGILWDEGVNYLKKVVRDAKAWDEIWDKLLVKCREKYDKFEGSWHEKSLKAMECGLPMVGYIIRQKIFF